MSSKTVLCGLDIPDQTSASLRLWCYGTASLQAATVLAFCVYLAVSVDLNSSADVDEDGLYFDNDMLESWAWIIGASGCAALVSTIWAVSTGDRGWSMWSCVLHMLTVGCTHLYFPQSTTNYFALAVHATCLAAAWCAYRYQEKLQEERMDADAVVEKQVHLCGACDLPDMTVSRMSILITVLSLLMIATGTAIVFLILELGPEYNTVDQWYNGAIAVWCSVFALIGAWLRHRTALLAATASSFAAMSILAFSLDLPLAFYRTTKLACDNPTLTASQKNSCEDQKDIAIGLNIVYFAAIIFASALAWAVWRFSEIIQDYAPHTDGVAAAAADLPDYGDYGYGYGTDDAWEEQEEKDEGGLTHVDRTLHDPFSCCGVIVQDPIAAYTKAVYVLCSGGFLVAGIVYAVLAAMSDEEGREQTFARRHGILAGALIINAAVSTFGARSHDRGLLVFSWLLNVVVMSNSMAVLQFDAGFLAIDEYADTLRAKIAQHGPIYGSFVNLDFLLNNPFKGDQEARAQASLVVSAVVVIAGYLTSWILLQLSEAIQDKANATSQADSDVSDDTPTAPDANAPSPSASASDDDYTLASASTASSSSSPAASSSSASASSSSSSTSASSSSASSSSASASSS